MALSRVSKDATTITAATLAVGAVTSKFSQGSFATGAKVSGVFLLSYLAGGLLSCAVINRLSSLSTKTSIKKADKEWCVGMTALLWGWAAPYWLQNALSLTLSKKELFAITGFTTTTLLATLSRQSTKRNPTD